MEELKYCYKYPRPAVTADCVILGFDKGGLSVLLVQRGSEPYKGCWAFPGGFLNMDEDAETGAKRELNEETGFVTETIEQFGTFSSVNRDPRGRVITIAFYALVQKGSVKGGDDAADACWFPIDRIPRLAFDHDEVLNQALQFLWEKLHFKPIGIDILPDEFSMEQLQGLYECIPRVSFEADNFSKQMLGMGLLEEVSSGKDEVLYRFDEKIYFSLKKEGFRLDF